MASSGNFPFIKLTENDVPGAKLSSSDLSSYTVEQLKRWLQCRSLSASGTKSILIDRCSSAMTMDLDISIAIDNGVHYQRKVETYLQSLSSASLKVATPVSAPPLLPLTGWKSFPSQNIPSHYSDGSIYKHLITSAQVVPTNDCDDPLDSDFMTSKPLKKGRQYFISGHIVDMSDTTKNGHYFVKCKVKASFKRYILYVAGLLFALEDYTIQFGYEPPSCTSKLCTWNTGRKAKQPHMAHVEKYSKKHAPDRVISWDPRPESPSIEDQNQFVHSFIKSLPTIENNTMFELCLEIDYEDYELDALQKNCLLQQVCQFEAAMKENSGNEVHEIQGTRGQSASDEWHNARWCRLTASKCKDYITTKSSHGLYQLLDHTVWGKQIPETVPIRYGKTHESDAFDTYALLFADDDNISVTVRGFWINPAYPIMGSSPDGLVYTNGKLTGVVEIKCPYVLRDCHPVEAPEKLLKKQIQTFCCSAQDGSLHLKKTHKYYYQVQMQMMICEVDYCDFVLWSRHGINVERVVKDVAFWNEIVP